MSLRLALVRRLPDRVVSPLVIGRLARATGEAFGTTTWPRPGMRPADRLTAYARFTAAEAAHHAGDEAVEERLFRNAAALGRAARRGLGIRGSEEALDALTLLYRCIGIEIDGHRDQAGGGGPGGAPVGATAVASGAAPGGGVIDLHVTRCFFSDYYCEDTCRFISAMDAGVVAGLFDGASLEFSQRLTDGSPCCRAVIRTGEARA
jgi:hypothetical protein